MQLKEVYYYIMDSNNKFVAKDQDGYFIYLTVVPSDDTLLYEDIVESKDATFNLYQGWLEGEYGALNVKFPLRAVKVTSVHTVVEI